MEKSKYLGYAEKFFQAHGSKSIFLGRFVGVLRAFVPFVAGLFKMPTRQFFLWNILSAVLWAGGYAALGYFSHGAILRIEKYLTRAGILVLVAIILAVIFIRRYSRKN